VSHEKPVKESGRILVVDDNPANLQVLMKMLTDNGFITHPASEGELALRFVRSTPPDLILLDILMPGMDGYEVCRQLKRDERTREIPIIFMTALSETQDKVAGFQLGAVDYITKPFQAEEALARVRTHIALHAMQKRLEEQNRQLQREITERRRAEAALQKAHDDLERRVTERTADLAHVNRMLSILSECNLALVRVKEEPALLQEICRIIIDLGGYPLVWIGYAEQDAAKSVRPVAQAGFEEGYLDNVNITWADTERGRGPTGSAIRNAEPCIAKNIQTDPGFAPWRREAIRRNYASSIALPLMQRNDLVFGALNIYATVPDGFPDEEVGLLMKLADNLAFGINSLRERDARRQAEEEQKKLQAQLLQSQKLELVGRLAGGVAHDFNNILAVIIGNTEMALLKVAPSDPLRARLQRIEKAARRSADLIRQLLAFARNQTISPINLNLNEAVPAMLTLLRGLIGEDIELNWAPSEDLWHVKLDPSQIDQVLTNLCVNARDAITGVGRIRIETDNITFAEDHTTDRFGVVRGEYVLLSVNDNGCGMDEEIQEHLFEPFYTTKNTGEGTGLGLATVYGIVKQNDGFIDVISEPGKGSTFNIYFPRQAEAPDTIPPAISPEQVNVGGLETILLVEDEPELLELCQSMLQSLGYRVLSACTPTNAIQQAQSLTGDIHLLVTDVVMPEMNGSDLVKQLRTIQPNLKYLFMSGYTASVIANRGILENDLHFIQKPFAMKDLAHKVRMALDES
jgi:CheY-like chemotaxis protein